jgi:hypothetical protein
MSWHRWDGGLMKGSRFRIQAAALLFVMLPAVAGVVAIRASATCERFVKTYITKPVRNRVSKTTAEAWEQWRIAHPNWKPNPNLHRPKYVMNREESVQKVEFACSAPLIDPNADGLFPVADIEPPIVNFPPMKATQIQFPNEVPPEVAEITPQDSWPPLATFVPPVLGGVPAINNGVPPPIPGETPEPGSLLLAVTGLPFVFLMLAGRMRASKAHALQHPEIA